VKKGVLKTPPTDAGILDGVTRNVVMELARAGGIEVVETNMLKHDIYVADECFLTGTAAEVIPVVELDKRPIADGTPGEITKELRKQFQAYVRQE
ncbi:MAG: branched-chain amino acid aminotransferase, partial [Planctomicrobium sp.]|nr:branched-chain amino acid aminotransferase [Planctomicrobium sp.]